MPISISCILANPEAYSLTCLIRQVVWCTGTHFHFNTRFQSPNNLFVKLLNCRQYLWLTEVSGMFQNNLIWQFNFTLKNTLLFEFAQDSYRQKSVTACHTYRKIRICKKKIQNSYTAGRKGNPILVKFVRVKHAELNRQLSLIISDDGEGQLALSCTVECHHILHRRRDEWLDFESIIVFIICLIKAINCHAVAIGDRLHELCPHVRWLKVMSRDVKKCYSMVKIPVLALSLQQNIIPLLTGSLNCHQFSDMDQSQVFMRRRCKLLMSEPRFLPTTVMV